MMTAEQLKNSILQLALQGKLVPQNSTDKKASDLLKEDQKNKKIKGRRSDTFDRIATRVKLIGNPVNKIELLDDIR